MRKTTFNSVSMKPYPGLPEMLKEYHVYTQDSGHSLCAIPLSLLEDARAEPWQFEVPIPVKYVLEKGYTFFCDYIVVDVPYDEELGVVVDEKYEEYEAPAAASEFIVTSVGEKIPPVLMGFDEGAHLLVDGSGSLILLIMYSRPTENEIMDMSSKNRFEYACLMRNGVLVFLAKPGKQEWMEAYYKPPFGAPAQLATTITDGFGLSLSLLLVDKATGILKIQRMIGLDQAFSAKFVELARESDKMIDTPEKWLSATGQMQSRYTTHDMVVLADARGQIHANG